MAAMRIEDSLNVWRFFRSMNHGETFLPSNTRLPSFPE